MPSTKNDGVNPVRENINGTVREIGKALLFRLSMVVVVICFPLYVFIPANANIHILKLGFDGNICDDGRLFIYLFIFSRHFWVVFLLL